MLLRVQDQTGLQPYYSWKISAAPHDSGREGGMFTTAPRCNFAGRDSVGGDVCILRLNLRKNEARGCGGRVYDR